jgi:hypothetical protein
MTDIPVDTRPTLARLRKSGAKRSVSLKDFPAEWLPSKPAAVAAATPIANLPSAGVGSQGGAVVGEKKEGATDA